MHLPLILENKNFAQWNYIVKGVMEVWELASIMGLGDDFERRLANDYDGTFAEHIGNIGNTLARHRLSIPMSDLALNDRMMVVALLGWPGSIHLAPTVNA